mmetsp:Transcript_18421/g.38569  ORF Transcript_18421/g.38569 Transcript_18421/m.38569 type:complete len:150 (-) Transcript_18421:4088-4537(-)
MDVRVGGGHNWVFRHIVVLAQDLQRHSSRLRMAERGLRVANECGELGLFFFLLLLMFVCFFDLDPGNAGYRQGLAAWAPMEGPHCLVGSMLASSITPQAPPGKIRYHNSRRGCKSPWSVIVSAVGAVSGLIHEDPPGPPTFANEQDAVL